MKPNEVDITYQVKPSEANGRCLIKNIDTGETYWQEEITVDEVPPFVAEAQAATTETKPRGKGKK